MPDWRALRGETLEGLRESNSGDTLLNYWTQIAKVGTGTCSGFALRLEPVPILARQSLFGCRGLCREATQPTAPGKHAHVSIETRIM